MCIAVPTVRVLVTVGKPTEIIPIYVGASVYPELFLGGVWFPDFFSLTSG